MDVSTTASATLSPDWRAILEPRARLRIAVLAALILWVYWDVLRHQVAGRWMNDSNWSHGWLIPLFSLYYLSTRREQIAACKPKANYWGALVLILSLAAYFVSGWRLHMAYPQALTLITTLLGTTLLLGGWSVLRIAWFPIVFLLLAIPLPQSQYVSLTMPLRKLASQVAAAVMPMFASGLHTEAQSVVIDYVMPGGKTGQLNVEEACSGMRSIMAIVTLGVAVAALHPRPRWQRIILVLSCLPIALFCNSIRVTVTGLLHIYGYRDLAQGTPHTVLGLLLFGVAVGLYLLIGYALEHLFVEEADDDKLGGASKGNG